MKNNILREVKQLNNQKYQLLSAGYKSFLFSTLVMTVANNIAFFIDSIFISHFLGIEKLPAVELCFPVMTFVSMVYLMLGLGGSTLALNHMADHEKRKADETFTVSVVFITLLGIFLAVFGRIFSEQFAELLSPDISYYNDVLDYLSILVLGMPLVCLMMSLAYFAKADGKHKMAFHAVVISNVINMVMNVVLIKVMGMGLSGAAFATIIGYFSGLMYMMRYFFSKDRQLVLVKMSKKAVLSHLHDITLKGFPESSYLLMITLRVHILNMIVAAYGGSRGLQVFSIFNNCIYMFFTLALGIAQTLVPLVIIQVQNGDYDRVRKMLFKSIKAALAGALALCFILELAPQIILMLFNVSDPQTAAECIKAIRISALSFMGMAFCIIMVHYFQAVEHFTYSHIITIMEGLVLPIAMMGIFAPFLGVDGLYMGFLFIEILVPLQILFMVLREDSLVNHKKYSFMLPKKTDDRRFEFTVAMDLDEVVSLSKEASDWVSERTDDVTAMKTCLAVEEMLTGITAGNTGSSDMIDVVLREEDDKIIITIHDTGREFNPTIVDENFDYAFDNAYVLNKIADEITYNRAMGINSTMIKIQKK